MQEETELNGQEHKVCKGTLYLQVVLYQKEREKISNRLHLARKAIGHTFYREDDFLICSFACLLPPPAPLFYPNMAVNQGLAWSRVPIHPRPLFLNTVFLGHSHTPLCVAVLSAVCSTVDLSRCNHMAHKAESVYYQALRGKL